MIEAEEKQEYFEQLHAEQIRVELMVCHLRQYSYILAYIEAKSLVYWRLYRVSQACFIVRTMYLDNVQTKCKMEITASIQKTRNQQESTPSDRSSNRKPRQSDRQQRKKQTRQIDKRGKCISGQLNCSGVGEMQTACTIELSGYKSTYIYEISEE